jgi:hypothetical protein
LAAFIKPSVYRRRFSRQFLSFLRNLLLVSHQSAPGLHRSHATQREKEDAKQCVGRVLVCRARFTNLSNGSTLEIQGQADFNCVDNVRGCSGSNAFGNSGEFAVFTIAPTIKPKVVLYASRDPFSPPASSSGAILCKEQPLQLRKAETRNLTTETLGWLRGSQMEIWF